MRAELDEAVAAGRLTQAQADELLAGAEERVTEMVNGTLPRGHRRFGSSREAPPAAASGAFSGSTTS